MAKRNILPAYKLRLTDISLVPTIVNYNDIAINEMQSEVLPDAYNVYRMDLYVWNNKTGTGTKRYPKQAYQGSYWRNPPSSFPSTRTFVGKSTIAWDFIAPSPNSSFYKWPIVYYVNNRGDIIHSASLLYSQSSGGSSGGTIDISACFPLETLVATPTDYTPLGKIKLGDEVLGFYNNKTVITKVTAIHYHRVAKYLSVKIKTSKAEFISTYEHLVLTEEVGWISASLLKPGMHLINGSNEPLKIEEMEDIVYDKEVRNIETKKCHTYMITKENIVVHNDKEFVWEYLIGGGS